MIAIEFPAVTPQDAGGQQTVYVRTAWSDSWQIVPGLFCTDLSFSASPTIGTASFFYQFGPYVEWGSDTWQTANLLTFNPRTYVKVVCTSRTDLAVDDFAWYGIWKRAQLDGTTQTFTADGLEKLLDVPCADVPYLHSGGSIKYVGRGLEFNAGGKPNRSANTHTVNGWPVYVFEPDASVAQHWSTRDAVQLLTALASPKEADGTIIFNWAQDFLDLPSWDRVQMATHNVSYWRLLGQLIPEHKLTSFAVDGDDFTPTIRAFNFNESIISFTDSSGDPVGDLAANTNTATIDIAADQSGSASLATEASQVADRVTVVCNDGREIVCSLSVEDTTLERRSSAGDLADYIGVASTIADYANMDTDQKERAVRDARSSDQHRHTLTRFGVPDNWDQKIYDGEAGTENDLAIVDDSDPEEQFLVYPALLRIKPRTPFLSGYDYHEAIIGTNETDDVEGHRGDQRAGAVEPFEELPLLVFFKSYQEDPSDPDDSDLWVMGDKIGESADVEPIAQRVDDEPQDRRWSVAARPVTDSPTIELTVQGEQQWAIAHDDFAVADLILGSLDYRRMIVTVAFADPRPIEVVYPAAADQQPVGEFVSELFVEVRDKKFIDVRPGTVVDIDPANSQLRRSTGGILQDDRPSMRVIGQRLYNWHKDPRYSLKFSTGYIDSRLQIGMLITEYTGVHDATATAVGSVVTNIALEFSRGQSADVAPARMSVQTAFGEMDAEAIAPV